MTDFYSAIYSGLKLLNIPFTKSYILQFGEQHNGEGTLLCMQELFEDYKIEATAGKFDEKHELLNYPNLHISQLVNNERSYFVTVEKIIDEEIFYYFEGKEISETITDYFKKWSGYALFLNSNSGSEEPNFKYNLRKQFFGKIKLPFLLFTLITAFLIFPLLKSDSYINTTIFCLLIVKFSGLVISIALIYLKFGFKNTFIDEVCKLGVEGGCNNIVQSKSGNVFSFLSWAEVGLFYFGTTLIALLYSTKIELQNLLFFLQWFSFFSLFYVIYSISYQKFIAKTWCTLCILIQFIFIAENLLLWYNSKFLFNKFYIQSGIYLLVILCSIVSIWYIFKPLLEGYHKNRINTKALIKFKKSKQIFNFLMQNEQTFVYPNDAIIIQLGNLKGRIKLDIFLSPFCKHCEETFSILRNFVEDENSKTFINIYFATSNNSNNKSNIAANFFLQIQQKEGNLKAYLALSSWYNSALKNIDNFDKIINSDVDLFNITNQAVKVHNLIASKNHVNATPTIFINNKRLSNLYQGEDLGIIIKNL